MIYSYNRIVKLWNGSVVLDSYFVFLLWSCFIYFLLFVASLVFCCLWRLLLLFACFLIGVLYYTTSCCFFVLTLHCGSHLWIEAIMTPSAIALPYYRDVFFHYHSYVICCVFSVTTVIWLCDMLCIPLPRLCGMFYLSNIVGFLSPL
jgi:hypothetical protein